MFAIEAKGNPARFVAKEYISDLLRRHNGGVEDVEPPIGSIGNPDFAFIGCHANPMTGAAMPFNGPDFEILYFDAVQHFPCFQIANLEP